MKTTTTILSLIIAVFCFTIKSQASHFLGADLGYTSIAPGIYFVEYKAYYDCRGAILPTSVPLNLVSPGCGGNQTITANLARATNTLNPYCAATGNGCTANGLINVIEANYSTLFTASSNCAEWILSVRECSKAPVANLVNNGAGCLYLEAYINTGFAGNHNISPAFSDEPSLFKTVNSPATINNLASSRWPGDTDSMAYSLKPALDNYNVPATYTGNNSYSDPIPSATGVNLNPATGLLTFTPTVFSPTGGYGANTYTVVIEAAGYKKINGVMTKVNSAQRSIPIIVVNNAPNQNPEIINVTANGQPVPPNDIVQVVAGNFVNIQFGTSDANAADSVSISLPPPSGVFSSSGGARPTGTITLQTLPNASYDQLIYYPLVIKDNACPVRGVTTRIIRLKIVANPLGMKNSMASETGFTAFPNPFSEEVNFKFDLKSKAERISIYNLLGQQIDQISLQHAGLGKQNIQWQNAHKYAAGTYVAKLISGNKKVQTVKFTKMQ